MENPAGLFFPIHTRQPCFLSHHQAWRRCPLLEFTHLLSAISLRVHADFKDWTLELAYGTGKCF